jgi:hypothetical protein
MDYITNSYLKVHCLSRSHSLACIRWARLLLLLLYHVAACIAYRPLA